jgi:ribose/xylose/arabinose/galactoside ABC-type transport system permease subunit
MNSLPSKRLGRPAFRFNELALVGAIVAVVLLTTLLDTNHSYWNDPTTSIRNIARNTSMLGIFSLGAAVVIIAGGIDLSSGSMIAFSGTVCATFMLLLAPEEMKSGEPLSLTVIAVSIAGTLIVGLLIGTLHTWLIAIVRLPPFIATLGTLVGLRSLARLICGEVNGGSSQIQLFDDRFRYLGQNVWISVLVFAVLSMLVWLLLSRTVIGRHLYALGGNEEAARLSGIRTERIKWLAYCIGSVTASIAGILYIGQLGTAEPDKLCVGYELYAIAAAVVGGCSLSGGLGTVPGTVLGVLFLQEVIDAVAKVIHKQSQLYEGTVLGLVLICASVFSRFREMAGHKKQLFPGLLGWLSIVSIAMFSGLVLMMMWSRWGGVASAAAVFVALAIVKFLEVRRTPAGAAEQRT